MSIGKQVPNTVTPGEHVYGDLMKARSQKGTDYWKFKSQKVPDDVQRPASSPAQAQAQQAVQPQGVDMSARQPDWFQPWGNMITYIYNEMKKMDADAVPEPSTAEPLSQPEPAKVEQVGGEPLPPEEKAMLDGIFGGGNEPEPEV